MRAVHAGVFICCVAFLNITTSRAQGLPNQGEGQVDGDFLKPDLPAFLSHGDWQYTFDDPGVGWKNSVVPSAPGWSWTSLNSFHAGGLRPGDNADSVFWPWENPDVWARSIFTISETDIDDLMFWGRWDDGIEIFINGVSAVERPEWSPSNRYLGLSDSAKQSISSTHPNVLAVHVNDTGGDKHLNLDLVRAAVPATLPINGTARNAAFIPIVEFVQSEMTRYGVTAGALSVYEIHTSNPDDAAEMVNVGIGYMDKQFEREVLPEHQFRLASLDKHPVKAAINKLVEDDVLSFDDNAWDILQNAGVQAINGTPDPDAAALTIGDIYHTRQTSVAYTWDDAFFNELGVTKETITEADLMSWLFSKPTDGTSGYNPCSDMLRFIADFVAPGGLNAYLNEHWGAQFIFAGGEVENRNTDENGELRQPWYSTFANDDDAYQLDAIRIMASTAKDNTVFWVRNNTPQNGTWIWYGGIGGTSTFMRTFRSADNSRQIYVTALFNQGGVGFGDAPLIDGAVQNMLATLPANAWSDADEVSWPTEPSGGCTCPSGCDAVVYRTVPTIIDGANNTCYFFDSFGNHINNWNNAEVDINGEDITNSYMGYWSLPEEIDGGYYIYQHGTFPWSHLEVQ